MKESIENNTLTIDIEQKREFLKRVEDEFICQYQKATVIEVFFSFI